MVDGRFVDQVTPNDELTPSPDSRKSRNQNEQPEEALPPSRQSKYHFTQPEVTQHPFRKPGKEDSFWHQGMHYARSLFNSNTFSLAIANAPMVLRNLRVNSLWSMLTMLGVTIGVAAMVSIITIGQFTKRKVLDSYAELGVSTFMFRGYTNWNLKATDAITSPFRFFDWDRDILPLKRIFPEVENISPILTMWGSKIFFGGRVIDNDALVVGMAADGFQISKRALVLGRSFSPVQVERKSNVCVIGYEIFEKLFSNVHPIGQIIGIKNNDNSFTCRVIGVLASKTSNREWSKPNLQLIVPFTFFQNVASHWWESRIIDLMIRVQTNDETVTTGEGIKKFFEKKYGVRRFRQRAGVADATLSHTFHYTTGSYSIRRSRSGRSGNHKYEVGLGL